jgi:hypothetical protein
VTTVGRRSRAPDVRGATRLAVDATLLVTDVVEAMHARIARTAAVPDTPVHGAVRQVSALTYGAIRGTTRLAGTALDAALDKLAPLLPRGRSTSTRDAVVAALNGVVGDHLAASGNPLAIPMSLRHAGRPLRLDGRVPVPGATGKLLVLVHGLCMSDHQWTRDGHDHGAALARDLGLTPVYVRYNTGLHVSDNGRRLADQLEQLVARWPTRVREIVLLGHSMGGLVIRSACAAGAGQSWTRRLRALVFLGTPHHGSALERGGRWADVLLAATPWTAPLARLGHMRSAGITDLRHGRVLTDDVPVPLPDGVACHALAASLGTGRGGRPRGDGLVSVDSALGRHRDRRKALRVPRARRAVLASTGHLELLGSPAAYDVIRRWLAPG